MKNDFILAERLSFTIRSEVAKAIPETINGHELETTVLQCPSCDCDDIHVKIKVICPALRIYEHCSFVVNLYEYSVDSKKTTDLIKHMISSILENINEKEDNK